MTVGKEMTQILKVIINLDVFTAWLTCIDLLHEVCPPLQFILAKNCPL